MSIVALKKKHLKQSISGKNNGGFSLVGKARANTGTVGNANLARYGVRTPFKGSEPVGHGGSQGKYVLHMQRLLH